MMIGMDLTIDGVGLDIKGHNLKRIGMHVERVTL